MCNVTKFVNKICKLTNVYFYKCVNSLIFTNVATYVTSVYTRAWLACSTGFESRLIPLKHTEAAFYSFCTYCINYPVYIKCNRLATITLVTLYCIIVKTILFKQSHSQLHHIQHSNLLLIITLPQTH